VWARDGAEKIVASLSKTGINRPIQAPPWRRFP
jgi:hypothetical protein